METRKEKILNDLEVYQETMECDSVYEEQWKKMKCLYPDIYIYKLDYQGLGETLPRAINMIKDFQCNKYEKRLNVVVPAMSPGMIADLYNYRMLEILSRYMYIVKLENIRLWNYIFQYHYTELNCSEYAKYHFRRAGCYDVSYGTGVLDFSDAEKKEARKKMKKIGIEKPFVCVHGRGSEGKKNYTDLEDWSERCIVRNCDVNSFQQAATYLEERKIPLIRMGKYEKAVCNLTNCIDYANEYYDSLLDFYLLKECKFLIGSSSGLSFMTGFFGKAVLITNQPVLSSGFGSIPKTEYDLIIFIKLWSKSKKRYLNLYEMMVITELCQDDILEFQKRGIEIIHNSPEEIYEAAKEINQRIDGTWKESESDIKRQEKFKAILEQWRMKHKTELGMMNPNRAGITPCPYRVGAKFLSENEELLDCDNYFY